MTTQSALLRSRLSAGDERVDDLLQDNVGLRKDLKQAQVQRKALVEQHKLMEQKGQLKVAWSSQFQELCIL